MRRLAALALALGACGAPASDVRRADEPASAGAEAWAGREEPPDDPRALGAGASFADLLGAARTLDDRRDQESSAGCLLRRGWRLTADLAVAVRPLPPAPDDLDDALARHPGPVNALSRWGAYGSGEPSAPSFAAVTTTLPPRREPALVWAVTDEGVYVRSTQDAADDPRPLTVDALPSAPIPEGLGALFVTAEAGTSLERLAQVLALVPPALAGRVGLAVALAPGTRLPAPPEAAAQADTGAGLCPGGLPEPAPEARLGELPTDVMVQRLSPLRERAAICVTGTEGPGAAGGRVVLALRIGPDGTIDHACVAEDATHDPVLRACILRAARSIALPAPSPEGFVDVSLPLLFQPLASQRQTPLCE